jgi:hypothetical protein
MERRKAVTDELAYKVNYVRDWLNKAEAAIQRGDTIEAIAKLSLAKADTTNLISTLIPQAKEYKRPQLVPSHSFAWRRLVMLAAPLMLIGCFLLGIAVGGTSPAGSGYNTLNPLYTKDAPRSVERPTLHGDLLALVGNINASLQNMAGEANTQLTDNTRKAVARSPIKPTIPAKASGAVGEETPETVAVSDGAPAVASGEEPLDLFDFGLDVIRSARQNMGR